MEITQHQTGLIQGLGLYHKGAISQPLSLSPSLSSAFPPTALPAHSDRISPRSDKTVTDVLRLMSPQVSNPNEGEWEGSLLHISQVLGHNLTRPTWVVLSPEPIPGAGGLRWSTVLDLGAHPCHGPRGGPPSSDRD